MSDTGRLETVARRALVCLDLTNLEDDCDAAAIDDLCRRAQTEHGSVAAVCIWPRFVTQAAASLDRTGIKVATVVNFPTGSEPLEDVLAMTRTARADGADEIDLVVPYRRLMDGDADAVTECVRAVKEASGDATVKAILETGELADAAAIGLACEHALDGGADFLKTSTGKAAVNATPEAAEIMLRAIARRGGNAGFKAAGGVRSVEDAARYLALCDEIMGTGWAGPRHFRFGASGLLAALLSVLGTGDDAGGDDGY
jgi:deoxyribose-phosphate aldolase